MPRVATETGAAEDATETDTMAATDDGIASATQEDAAVAGSVVTADGTEDTADEGEATEAAAGDDTPAATEEGTKETEQPIVETRVVPDEPVEQAEEPTIAPDVLEETTTEEEPAPAVLPPSFDIVRIKPDGSAVIAGRAPARRRGHGEERNDRPRFGDRQPGR